MIVCCGSAMLLAHHCSHSLSFFPPEVVTSSSWEERTNTRVSKRTYLPSMYRDAGNINRLGQLTLVIAGVGVASSDSGLAILRVPIRPEH